MKATKKAKEPKKYTPDVLSSYKYRGYRVREVFNHKTRRREFKARFQLNNFEYTPVADSKKAVEEIIDDLIYNARRQKENLEVKKIYPTLEELFAVHLPKIEKKQQQGIFSRVSNVFLSLLPADIKINELKKAHFQKYIDLRRKQKGIITHQPILDETIDKELYSISSALKAAPLYFADLEDYQKPVIPKAAPRGPKRRRRKIVSKEKELDLILNELRKPKTGKQTAYTQKHRERLADDLEFRYETGLRKKEVEKLKTNQYFAEDGVLRNVIRWKTGTVTEFFPLTQKAARIIERRIKENDSEYIFTEDGESRPADYRTLKIVCEKLNIAYGRYAENGFIPHDLRRSFASNFIQYADIETAREFLGHSNIAQTGAYLRTNEQQMRQAIRKREGADKKSQLVEIYKDIKRGKIKLKDFIKKVQKLTDF